MRLEAPPEWESALAATLERGTTADTRKEFCLQREKTRLEHDELRKCFRHCQKCGHVMPGILLWCSRCDAYQYVSPREQAGPVAMTGLLGAVKEGFTTLVPP